MKKKSIQKNIDTLSDVVVGTARTAIVLLTIFLALSQIGVDLAPLIVAAGAIAVGVGFAVQNLIRDVLGGIFITLENQYRIGDVVSIAGIAGLVEDINLRRTLLRDLDYKQHTIPNGTITHHHQLHKGHVPREHEYRRGLQDRYGACF